MRNFLCGSCLVGFSLMIAGCDSGIKSNGPVNATKPPPFEEKAEGPPTAGKPK